MIKIAVLTSSRADFGIYLPLLKRLGSEQSVELNIVAFGTHLSDRHGKTINDITKEGFKIHSEIESMMLDDTSSGIASTIGVTVLKFAEFWKANSIRFDIVFVLGDRYEMFAAVMAAVPFNITFAHIHGGETSLGAIDNIFRHSITLASKHHFVATKAYAKKVSEITGSECNIYNVGALSLDNLNSIRLMTINQFNDKWGIDLSTKTILVTFHPETIAVSQNQLFTLELIGAINDLSEYKILITMPNADTNGMLVRNMLRTAFDKSDRVFLVENLGTQSYFSAMKHCSFLLGNTSSGIIEAASFGKYVINIGDRQKGRIAGKNVIHVPISRKPIVAAARKIESASLPDSNNIYYNGGASEKIYEVLKKIRNV